jgi:hypothetical protein
MTPVQRSLLSVMSPTRGMTVREIAEAAFNDTSARQQQRVYQRLDLSGFTVVKVYGGQRNLVGFRGLIIADGEDWPRQWRLTEAGVKALGR